MDGLKLWLRKAGNEHEQSMFYNNWTHNHYVSCLFLFFLNGQIGACYINAPGTCHDSLLAKMGGVYEKVDQMFAAMGGKIIVNSAFARTKHRASLVKSYQSNVDRQGRFQQSPALNKDATSVRQLSEWGMRAFQSAFPRVCD